MFIDSQLLFSDAQAVTAAAGSTNTLDLGVNQGATNGRDIGTGTMLYVVVTVDVAMTIGGITCTVALEGDSTTSFTPDGTQDLFVIPALTAAGSVFIASLDPGAAPLQYQYVRLKFTPNGGSLTTGSFTAFITKDIQKVTMFNDAVTIAS